MPLVNLENFENVNAPGDHDQPASIDNVDDATSYQLEVSSMYMHKRPQVQVRHLAAAQLHLVDTCMSYAQGQGQDYGQPPNNFQAMFQQFRNEILNETRLIRAEIQNEAQLIRNDIQLVRNQTESLHALAIETAVDTARYINLLRRHGSPMVPVRYPNGRLPEANRPPLTSMQAITDLSVPVLRSYVGQNAYNLPLPAHATIPDTRHALAVHLGAIV